MKSRRLSSTPWASAIVAASLTWSAQVGCKDEKKERMDDPTTPWKESRLSLTPARSCEEVRAHLIDVATETLLKQRYFPIPLADAGGGPAERNDSPSSGSSGPTDYTKTNVQEAGVDEDDIVKTDGRFVYTVRDGEVLILKSWPAQETTIVSRVSLGSTRSAGSLFLRGDRLVVFSSGYTEDKVSGTSFSGTRLTFIDVTDRAAPRVLGHRELEGWMSAARMIGSKVHVVLNASVSLPESLWQEVYSAFEDIPYMSDPEAMKRSVDAQRPRIHDAVTRALGSVAIDRIMPQTRVLDASGVVTRTDPIVGCTELFLPAETSSLGVLELSTFDLDQETPWSVRTTGVLASGWQIYASTDSLYAAMSSRWWWWGFGDQDNTSHIHKFTLSGDSGVPVYVGSGEVDGWILNQFSMSEYEGHLRVATTDNERIWNAATQSVDVRGGNHLSVLDSIEGELRVVGAIRDLSPGEQIYAARMMGPKGYIVTFRQTDPLFTLDLSDSTNPRVVGSLHVNGFSSYLHPLGEGHLLAIGQDADAQGRVQGVQLSIYDVRDPANPTRAFQERISTGAWSSWSEAMWDHHAFTYHPSKQILAFPASIQDVGTSTGAHFSGLLVYHASAEDGFRPIGRVDHSDFATREYCRKTYGAESCPENATYEWWAWMRRSVFIEDALYSLSNVGLKVSELLHPENTLATIRF